MTEIKAVFVDRDGTINVEKNYVHKIEDFELIPGSIDALQLLCKNGIKIFIITNQAGIAKGYFSEEEFLSLTDEMIVNFKKEEIEIEQVLYCPHHSEGIIPKYTKSCLCRKPNTQLILNVMERSNYKSNELIIIGDKNSDIEMGSTLGITTYLVQTGYGKEHQDNTKATYIKSSLLSAAKHMLQLEP